ncbi:unnamed protein product [Dicrocoelium dendriticum]|nr:unnamed protein product [Dicrocoelium dendriticum]
METMSENEEDNVLYFLKQNPQFLERYVKENCSEAQLHHWMKQIGRLKNDAEIQTTTNDIARQSSENDGQVKVTGTRVTSGQGSHIVHAVASASLGPSPQLTQPAKYRRTNRDFILSQLIDSICENISIDGFTLYLKDPYGNVIYPKPAKQPLGGTMTNPKLYPIESRQLLACLAAERKQLMNSADLPKGVRVAAFSIAPLTEAKHVLAQPLLNATEDIVAVIEVYRSPTRRAFTSAEIQLLRSMVRWARLVIESEDKLDVSERAQRLSDFILEVVRNFFSRIKNMDNVIKSIMEHAKQLVKAERVTLFIVDQKKNELYSSILDMGDVTCAKFVQDDSTEIRLPLGEGIAGFVATTGLPVRSNDTYSDSRFYRKVDETYNQVTKSVLAMPLTDGREVVGVIEMINKHEGIFTEEDENLLKIYSIYCGLAINVARHQNCSQWEHKRKLQTSSVIYYCVNQPWSMSSNGLHTNGYSPESSQATMIQCWS